MFNPIEEFLHVEVPPSRLLCFASQYIIAPEDFYVLILLQLSSLDHRT
jgi:hypothetical protein